MSDEHPHLHYHPDRKCARYLEVISDYVDGVLDEEFCRELEAHMETCDNCRVVVNTLAKTITLYRQMPAPEMPNAVKERLYHVLNLQDYLTPPEKHA